MWVLFAVMKQVVFLATVAALALALASAESETKKEDYSTDDYSTDDFSPARCDRMEARLRAQESATITLPTERHLPGLWVSEQ